jgi:hypothetical protein
VKLGNLHPQTDGQKGVVTKILLAKGKLRLSLATKERWPSVHNGVKIATRQQSVCRNCALDDRSSFKLTSERTGGLFSLRAMCLVPVRSLGAPESV